jgi:serine/threonine-protein kinase HipA
MANDARVILWGTDIGAVSWIEDRAIGVFQYAPDFVRSGIEVSPLEMPLRESPYEFPDLNTDSFRGLPGLLADSLPDDFGNALIDEWLASQGRTPGSMNPVERLCYTGTRGMGALEFQPATLQLSNASKALEIEKLVDLAQRTLENRANLGGVFRGEDDHEAIEDILRVGTSAGGARAKAILAWNPQTGEFQSGQLPAGPKLEYWIMKFDGVSTPRGRALGSPQGYGTIEYAYSMMASACGIHMTPCRLHHEKGRSHFMTRRFDRTETGNKLHMQSLAALAHYDYRQPTRYSYEQAIQVIRRLQLPREDLEQQLLRAIFNVVARNQDDHVKNIAFLMNPRGEWRLSPAFDVTFAADSTNQWLNQHQMSVNGKRARISRDDLLSLSKAAGTKTPKAEEMIDRVQHVVAQWPQFAEEADLDIETSKRIGGLHGIGL